MSPERWQQVCEVFNSALEVTVDDRAEWLAEVCRHDPGLLSQVNSLLRSHRRAEAALPDSLGSLAIPEDDEPAPDPEQIGPYRVQGPLGEGGMGRVYSAVRADREFEKQVAIKVMRADLFDAERVGRFRSERQILARLEHPNVARLLDGGTTEDQRPYLVMEYVEGRAIDRYCREENLSLDERLELFRKICGAVQVAHQNLIVHRDLKPANILVTDDGEPKLLDFGIAKLLEPESFPNVAVATAPGLSPMTLSHASPEQVRGESVTTASDIYSLGVLLYQLLTDRLPYSSFKAPKTPRGSDPLIGLGPFGGPDLHRVAVEICEKEPTRPSLILEPSLRWRRRLAGDLDAIVLKSLAKEPERRYASAEQLASDLDRYRQGLPIVARGQAWRYRIGKFLRRHRLLVAAAGLLVASTLAFIATLLIQRNEIERRQRGSEEVARLMVELFDNAAPDRALGERLTARDLVERGARTMAGRLDDEPEVRALLLSTLGRVYSQLGMLEEAEPLLEESLRLRIQALGPRDPAVAATLDQLAHRDYEAGDYGKAIGRFLEAEEILGDRPSPELALVLRGRARAELAEGDLDAAQGIFDRALAVARESVQPEDPIMAQILFSQARLKQRRGELESAREGFESALAIYRRAHGEKHPEVALTIQNLASVLAEKEQFERADRLFRHALALQREIHEPPHPRVATALDSLATSFYQQGRAQEAEEPAGEALALRTQLYGRRHSTVARSLNLLGLIANLGGHRIEAEAHFREALTIWRDLRGPEHPELIGASMNLGELLVETDRIEEGARYLEGALEISLANYGALHVDSATIATALGKTRKLQGDLAGAEALYRQALPALETALGGQHSRVATLHQNLGVLLSKVGRLDEAEDELRQALDIYRAIHGDGHPYVGITLKNLAVALRDAGHFGEAKATIREALETYGQVIPAEEREAHPWVVSARKVEASLAREEG